MSDGYVSCTAPAMRNASLQIPLQMSHACHGFWDALQSPRAHFFDIGTESSAPATKNDAGASKSGPNVVCFYHFDFESRFTPQRPCNFAIFFNLSISRSALRLVVFACSLKSASRHSGVQFLISHTGRWLRTRSFGEPTFRPPGATNIGKKPYLATFLHFCAPLSSGLLIFFLLIFFLLAISLLCLLSPLLLHLSTSRKFDF